MDYIGDRALLRNSKLIILIVTIALLAGNVFGWWAYTVHGDRVIEAAYQGQSNSVFNSLVRMHKSQDPSRDLPYYLQKGKEVYGRLVFITILIWLTITAFLYVPSLRYRPSLYFREPTSPINLAVFRIVLFTFLYSTFASGKVLAQIQVPMALWQPPMGLNWVTQLGPFNTHWVALCSQLYLLFCLTAILGFFSRFSALMVTLLGVGLLGLMQFGGKVDHFHHLMWFTAILSVSRCGDMLSVDALLTARKNADHGILDPPSTSVAYAIPIRFVWLLMGVAYFFPGYWKLLDSGLAWMTSENMRFMLYRKWTELDGWLPMFRIDQYPTACGLAGISVILLELGFIVAVIYPRLRKIVALGGLGFHVSVIVFMAIVFKSLMWCYVTFIDWAKWGQRLGKFLFRQELYVIFDDQCGLCRHSIASLRTMDVMGRITYISISEANTREQEDLNWLDEDALLRAMHVVIGSRAWRGYDAYRVLSRRMPLLWPLLPFLYLWPITAIGRRIYRHVADTRACRIVNAENGSTSVRIISNRSRSVIIVGCLLLFANGLFGLTGMVNAWPFACYPTFSGLAPSTVEVLEVEGVNQSGQTRTITTKQLCSHLSPPTRRALLTRILRMKNVERQRERLVWLYRTALKKNDELKVYTQIRFYRVLKSTEPQAFRGEPLARTQLLELEP